MFTYSKKNNVHYISFNYDTNIITYDKYKKMILECSSWYKTKIESVYNEYEELLIGSDTNKSLYIGNNHRNIIIELIKKVLSYYSIINSFDFGLFISNSFARGSNLINSDFDINYVYEDDCKDIGFQIEEQINYALTQIVGEYRDFVHDSIPHHIVEVPSFITLNKDDKLIFQTNWENCTEEYEISSGNERLMLRYCYGIRNKKSTTDYLLSYIDSNVINEWVYYQTILFGDKYISGIFDSIKEKELSIVRDNNSKKIFNSLIDKTKDDFISEISSYDLVDFNDMKNVKKYFKNLSYNKIYTFVSLTKKRMMYSVYDLSFDDILSNINNKDIQKELEINESDFDIIFDYFNAIMKLNMICNKCNIGFRTRYSYIIPNEFNECYNKYCEYIKNNYIEYHKNKSFELYSYLIKLLDKLRME